MKKKINITLFEKSFRKSNFLKKVSKELELKTEIIQKDLFKIKNDENVIITSRAFKPLPIVLNLVESNFSNFKNMILFMGKSGQKILNETLKHWSLNYEIKKSITNSDSFSHEQNHVFKIRKITLY